MVSELYPKHTHTSHHATKDTRTLSPPTTAPTDRYTCSLHARAHSSQSPRIHPPKPPPPLWMYAWPSLYTTSTHTLTHTHTRGGIMRKKNRNNFFKQNQETLVRSTLLKDIFHLRPSPVEWWSTKQSFQWLEPLDMLASLYHETSLMFALNLCS